MSAIGGAEWDGGERVEICMDSDFGLGSDWSGGVGDGVRFGAKTLHAVLAGVPQRSPRHSVRAVLPPPGVREIVDWGNIFNLTWTKKFQRGLVQMSSPRSRLTLRSVQSARHVGQNYIATQNIHVSPDTQHRGI